MGTRWSGILELLIVSVNYILIGYALSNIAMLLQSNPLFILFYASEIWVTGLYWRRAAKLTGSKLLSILIMYIGRLGPLTIASLWYFSRGERIGYAEGNIAIG